MTISITFIFVARYWAKRLDYGRVWGWPDAAFLLPIWRVLRSHAAHRKANAPWPFFCSISCSTLATIVGKKRRNAESPSTRQVTAAICVECFSCCVIQLFLVLFCWVVFVVEFFVVIENIDSENLIWKCRETEWECMAINRNLCGQRVVGWDGRNTLFETILFNNKLQNEMETCIR